MNQADYFRNGWWDMADSFSDGKERRAKLLKEQSEVFEEMILQEYNSGKLAREISVEYKLHMVTIYRIIKRARARNQQEESYGR